MLSLLLPSFWGWAPSLMQPRAHSPRAAVRCDAAEPAAANLASQLGRVASWAGKTVVIKYGGHAMTDASLAESFAADCALLQKLGLRLVVGHATATGRGAAVA